MSEKLTPNQVVCRVLGVGKKVADKTLQKLGSGASALPAAYEKGTARDLITKLKIEAREKADREAKAAKSDPDKDAGKEADKSPANKSGAKK